MALNNVDIEKLISKFGGRFEYWVTHRADVAKFIQKNKLAAVEVQHFKTFPTAAAAKPRGSAKAADDWWPYPIPFPRPFPWPGFRAPHLHYGGDIYVLTEKQWSDFSKAAIKGFQEKLARADSVGFAQLMELSDAMEGF
jgi:hypothetical protein